GAAAAAALVWSAQGAADAATVKLGVLAPLTGPASGDGEDYVHGVTMAVEEANKKGGIAGSTFEVMAVDVKDGSANAVTS
ncbi:ABC transporter substrate-binding protein, partial [Klebsiella pneumoniae]|uniref:ABC transporter substrate-binding protein n=1 Tax=Klebsiella pneumoniae TaxID=573 RepID=UPI0038539CF4